MLVAVFLLGVLLWSQRDIFTSDESVYVPVLAQVDLQPPIQLKPTLTLGRGGRHEETLPLVGSGELVTVTWQGVTSFPMEVEACPPNPADERAARQVTTTT